MAVWNNIPQHPLPSGAMTKYQYRRLSDNHSFIRLATILPGDYDDDDDDDEVTIQLDHIPFAESESPSRAYEALSYAWGDGGDRCAVRVRVRAEREEAATFLLPVTRNLAVALRHLRRRDAERVVWIDAVCIDQADEAEKSVQVAMMGSIYRAAGRVVAWLGPRGEGSGRAMGKLAWLGGKVAVDWASWGVSAAADGDGDGNGVADAAVPLPLDVADFGAIHALLSRAWFERLWVRQEIFLAGPGAVLCCGGDEVGWDVARRAMHLFRVKRFPGCFWGWGPRGEFLRRVERLRGIFFRTRGSAARLDTLRRDFGHSACGDPRDRVYAVLGMFEEAERRRLPVPDYGKAPVQVYRDFMLADVQGHGRLDLLASCRPAAGRRLARPSWVPDWSETLPEGAYVSAEDGSQYASAGLKAWVETPGPGILRVARVRGAVVAEARSIPNFPLGLRFSDFLDSLRAVFREGHLAGGYPAGGTNLGAHATAFARGKFAGTGELRRRHGAGEVTAGQMQEAISHLAGDSSGCTDGGGVERCGSLIARNVSGCQFVKGSGYVGLAAPGTRVGDEICAVLGCNSCIVLRPVEGESGRFLVVGECFVPGFEHGELVLGSLPAGVRRVRAAGGEEANGTQPAFENEATGETTRLDPRYGALGIDLDEHQRQLDRRGRWLPDVHPNILRLRGVGIEHVDLV